MIVFNKDEIWSADLSDVQAFSSFNTVIDSLNIFYSINVHGIIQYKCLNVRTKKRIRTEAGLIEFLSLTYVHMY